MQVKDQIESLKISGPAWCFKTSSIIQPIATPPEQMGGNQSSTPVREDSNSQTEDQVSSTGPPELLDFIASEEARKDWAEQMDLSRSNMEVSEAGSCHSKMSRKRTSSDLSDNVVFSPTKQARTGELIGHHD